MNKSADELLQRIDDMIAETKATCAQMLREHAQDDESLRLRGIDPDEWRRLMAVPLSPEQEAQMERRMAEDRDEVNDAVQAHFRSQAPASRTSTKLRTSV